MTEPIPLSAAAPHPGNVKATREDWLNVALDVLISDGVSQVKVLTLGERLQVSRSSFYWYFKSRQELLDALLRHWQDTNDAGLISMAEAPAATITQAVLNVFRITADAELFSTPLDFAIREWARRSGPVRRVLDLSDARRLDALTAMFARHAYPPKEAHARARVLYFTQLGYDQAELREPWRDRLALVPEYLLVFTGRAAPPEEVAAFETYVHAMQKAGRHA
ncbi:MAG: TetR/AcrR family transcriptional regulator [Pseudomonadota bacterium]